MATGNHQYPGFIFTVSGSLGVVVLVVMAAVTLSAPGHLGAQEQKQKESSEVPILTREQAETLPKESTQGEDIPLLGEDTERTLDELQSRGSELVADFATWVDSFFDNSRYAAEENRTRLKLKLDFGYSEFYDFEFQPGLDLRIHVPRLENRFNIFVRANDDSDFDIDSTPISNTDRNTREELTAGVQYFIAMGEKYNVSVDTGLSLNYAYAGLRYRHLHQFFSTDWDGRFTDRLRYYTDDGWENKASYDLERSLGNRFFWRNTLTGVVAERFDGLPASLVVSLYQVLNIERAILYDVGAYTNTEPEFELTDLQVKLRYRQRFYRDWLVLEVAPQLTFPREYDNDMNPGIVIKFEADFGYLKDQKAYDSIFKF